MIPGNRSGRRAEQKRGRTLNFPPLVAVRSSTRPMTSRVWPTATGAFSVMSSFTVAPVAYMVGITVQRQAGSKLMPMWEEECATACAVQNMHLQATAEPGLACYWSSWHSAARDSREMSDYLRMKEGDRCLGFFIVAACDPDLRIRRSRRTEDHLKVEWRD